VRPTTFALAVDLDAPLPTLLDRARTAERLGFDAVYVPDHSRNWRVDPRPGELWFDGWTVLTAMAMATSAIRVGTLVSNPVLRPPDLLVREALAVDHLSRGRLQLGIGTGIAGFDHDATGTPYWSLGERLDRFREYVEVVDGALRAAGGRYDHDGKFFRCSLTALPAPPQQPRPPITVAGTSKAVRATAVERADCWNTHGAVDLDEDDRAEHLAILNADVTARCEGAGRDPASLGRSVLLFQSFDPWTGPGRLSMLTERLVATGYDEIVVFWPWDDRRLAVFERDVAPGLDRLRGA
jgi:alkanesulfonate monooxygenase SsuD/methylene tetrahydromethanopterin reductase-like flavin-dependent oxidoreductase (luciferase family)